MNIKKSKNDIKVLLNKLEKNPRNLDLINSIAICYFENHKLKKDKEDYDFFEKAYKLKKTVKSTHNFAWFLYFEWSEIEWRWKQENTIEYALNIQKECLELNPKSFYPYFMYGYMLLNQTRFDEAIPFLERALNIESKRSIINNIGYCYFHIDNYQKAHDYFLIASNFKDIENISLYNLALTEWKLGNLDKVRIIADHLFKYIDAITDEITGYEVGLLFFLVEDYKNATECIIKQGISGIDLIDWTDLSYSVYKTNINLWHEHIKNGINKYKETIQEIHNNEESYNHYNDEEKNEILAELDTKTRLWEEVLIKGMIKPIPNLKESIKVEHCGCLLFDCKRHNNKEND